jgi:Leucine-rich repeat (LRR) protein
MTLTNCKLVSLDHLPKVESLTKLDLSDNKISGADLKNLTIYGNLTSLFLSGNNIKTLEEIETLKPIKNLIHLDFFNCAVSNLDNYRTKVFEIFPELLVKNSHWSTSIDIGL